MIELLAKNVDVDERYHHGNLRAALIAAAELELAENGPERFSLRGCARRANVSHAAPSHHFGDTAGLLDALIALGFDRLCQAMIKEMEAVSKDPADQMTASAVGYVRHAVDNPHLFKLMFANQFREERSAALIANSERAFGILVDVVSNRTGIPALKTNEGSVDIASLWSAVHGYAHLLMAKRLRMLTSASLDEHLQIIKEIAARSIPIRAKA